MSSSEGKWRTACPCGRTHLLSAASVQAGRFPPSPLMQLMLYGAALPPVSESGPVELDAQKHG